MAKKEEEQDLDIGEVYSKTELFLEKNKTMVIGAAVGLLVIVAGILFWNNHQSTKNSEGGAEIWKAEYYFEIDSLDLAINGDAQWRGFAEIAESYSGTPTGNLANYYLGAIYMKKGDFGAALSYYEEADVEDNVLSVMRVGGMGDANMELGDAEKAASLYVKAAGMETNEFLTPMYLFKAGIAYKELGKGAQAQENFMRVYEDYPNDRNAVLAKKYAVLYGNN